MAVVNSKVGRFGLFMANPMVAKLNKVEDSGEPSITKKGITSKTIFLLLLTLVGVAVFFLTKNLVPQDIVEAEGFEVNAVEVIIVLVLAVLAALGTFLSFKFVRSASLFGMFYSLVQGYSLAFILSIFGSTYLYACLYALGITIVLVFAMVSLYRMHLINVSKKFSSILVTLIFVGMLVGLGIYILDLIPATKTFAEFLINNSGIVAVCSVIGVILATLFLLVDFAIIDSAIEKKLPKKYEWLASFALSFSIIEVYFKILNLVLQFTQKSDNN